MAAKPKGFCPYCKTMRPLTVSGHLASHKRPARDGRGKMLCLGHGSRPAPPPDAAGSILRDFPALDPAVVADSTVQDVELYLGETLPDETREALVQRLTVNADSAYATPGGQVRKDMQSSRENACRDELRKWLEHWTCAEWRKIHLTQFEALQRIGFGWSLAAWKIRDLPGIGAAR